MARQFTVGLPEYPTKQRMKEVQFYLIIKQLKRHYNDSIYIDNVIENLIQLFGAKISAINYALDNMETLQFRPSSLELILCAKYMGIKMRTICGITNKASRTLYNALERYIQEGHYPIAPILSENIIEEIEKFNKGMHLVLGDITQIVSTSVTSENGQEVNYIYDSN